MKEATFSYGEAFGRKAVAERYKKDFSHWSTLANPLYFENAAEYRQTFHIFVTCPCVIGGLAIIALLAFC